MSFASRLARVKEVPFMDAIRAVTVDLGVELADELPCWILCPGHEERTPSCKVGEEFWYCHGSCKAGGDVLDFIRLAEGCDFKAALERVEAVLGLDDEVQAALAAARRSARPASERERAAWRERLDAVAEEVLLRLRPYVRSSDPVVCGTAVPLLDWIHEELRVEADVGPSLVPRAARARLRDARAWAEELASGVEREVERSTGKDRADVALAAPALPPSGGGQVLALWKFLEKSSRPARPRKPSK